MRQKPPVLHLLISHFIFRSDSHNLCIEHTAAKGCNKTGLYVCLADLKHQNLVIAIAKFFGLIKKLNIVLQELSMGQLSLKLV